MRGGCGSATGSNGRWWPSAWTAKPRLWPRGIPTVIRWGTRSNGCPTASRLVTGDKLRRQEPDGSLVVHAEQGGNEIVVDARGNIYLNGADFNFAAGAPPTPGYIKLVTPDGRRRQVAGDIQFPNGMVITPDDRTLIISESFAGQLTAFDIDADGGLSGRRVFAGGRGPDALCLAPE